MEQSRPGQRIESEFAAMLAHELRGPLNVVLGSLDLLLEGVFGPVTGEQAEHLRNALRNAREIVDLVNAALDLSRADAGQATLALQEVNVATLLGEIAEATRYQQQPDVAFVWHVAPALPPIRTDAVKLKIVLKNLVANAFKFTARGSVMVDAYRAAHFVEFSVIDTGRGIPAEAIPVIFDAFRQAEGTQQQRGSGLGLGLYIAHRLVELLGGTIEVASEWGRGSVFRVRVPLTPVSASC